MDAVIVYGGHEYPVEVEKLVENKAVEESDVVIDGGEFGRELLMLQVEHSVVCTTHS